MKTVTLYTDGACSGNPGPGGWGAILMYGEHKRELSGGERETTNNRMELTAVIRGLEALREPCAVELYSDSKYVVDALEKGWAKGWRARGWVKADKKPALNPDLWERLLKLCATHTVRLHWVKGHAENPYNNRCDEMAVSEWQKLKNGAHSARGGTIIERKKDSTMGKFVISKAKNGEYTFNLLATNGQVILSASETYSTLDSAKNGCASVAKNAAAHVEDQTKEDFEKLTHPKFELYKDKAGEFRWRLKARNGENIGRSEGYKAKSSAVNGIESVGRNGPDAPVVVEGE